MFNTEITLRFCHRTGKVLIALTRTFTNITQVYTCINVLDTKIKSKFNTLGDLHDRNGCCCKNTHQMQIWLQQRWPTQVTQPRPCFLYFSFQRMFCSLYRVFLTELNSIRSHHDHQYSQCSPCLKLTKITSGDKESTEKVKFYLQERWSRSVAPKHQSSEAPYFFSWSQSPSYSSLATGFPSVFLTTRNVVRSKIRGFGAREHCLAERPLYTAVR